MKQAFVLAGLATLLAAPFGLDAGTLVAEPEAQAWETPCFLGKPFWPLFAKLNHTPDVPGQPKVVAGSSVGLENLPLTQEYVSQIRTHSGTAGIAKYRRARGNGGARDAKGNRIYYTEIPESERHQGPYTLRHLYGTDYGDYLYEGDWSECRLWNPVQGMPFMLGIDESRPCFCLDGLDRGDKADFAAWQAKRPGFLGFSAMGEIDSDAGNYINAMDGTGGFAKVEGAMREDFERRFPVPRDRYDFLRFMRDCWKTEVKFHFGVDRFWPLYCNNHTLAHINAKMGAVGLQNEISSSQGSPWTWSGAYTRGASRQWGIPFTWYCATFYRGFRRDQAPGSKPVSGDNRWPRDGKPSKKRPAYCGASLSLTARQKYYGWLIGAAMIQDEPWTMLSASAENGVPCPSPYAKVFNDVYVRSTKIDRGAPLTPVALLTPLTETVTRGGYVNGRLPGGGQADLFNLPACFFTLQPVRETVASYPMLMERRRQGDEGCLFNSPFGEIWDVLVADAGQPTDRLAAALAHYPAAFLIGTYRPKDLDRAALKTYVENGGTLFLSADYVREGLVDAAFAGVSFGDEKRPSGESLLDEKGRQVESLGGAYELYSGAPAAGTRPLLKDEKGQVVAYVRALGRGRVVVTCARRSMPALYFNAPYAFNDRTYQELRLKIISGDGQLGLLRYLFDRVQRETIPVAVEGDIQWGVNKTEKGYLVWLINNKGVVKYYGEPQELDATKTAKVRLTSRLSGDWTMRDADNGTVLDGACVSVGPGDVRFVTVEPALTGDAFTLVRDGAPVVRIVTDPRVDAAVRAFREEAAKCLDGRLIETVEADPSDGARIVFDIKTPAVAKEDAFAITFPDARTMKVSCTAVSARWALNRVLTEAFGIRYLSPCKLPDGGSFNVYPPAKTVSLPRRTIVQPAYPYWMLRSLDYRSEAWNASWDMKGIRATHRILVDCFPMHKYAEKGDWPEEILPVLKGRKYRPPAAGKPLDPNPFRAIKQFRKTCGVHWNPCLSNPKSAEIAIANLNELLEKDPTRRFVHLDICDNGGMCECESCRRINGDRRTSMNHPDCGGTYWPWVNAVAEGVSKTHPDVYFVTLAYREVVDPPAMKLHPHVIVRVCFELGAMIDDAVRARRLETMRKWSQSASLIELYDYVHGQEFYCLPRVDFTHQSAYIAELARDYGVCGYYGECGGAMQTPLNGPRYFLIAEALKGNPSDPWTLAETWCREAVGPSAARLLVDYFRFWEALRTGEAIRRTPWFRHSVGNIYMGLGGTQDVTALAKGDMTKCRSLMEEVVAKADTPDRLCRAKALMEAFRLSEDAAQAMFAEILRPEGNLASAADAVELLRQLPAARAALERLKKNFYVGNFCLSAVEAGHQCNLAQVSTFAGDPVVRAALEAAAADASLPSTLRAMLRVWGGETHANLLTNGSFPRGAKDLAAEISVPVSPGHTYLVLFDAMSPTGSAEGRFSYRISPWHATGPRRHLHGRDLDLPAGQWQHYSCAVTTVSGDLSLRGNFYSKNYEEGEKVLLDNVRVYDLGDGSCP